ncbi:MAG: site-specific DNA-methyltransferase [Lachnospiraceae bacterium]|nr:site-specific DNA-methyltransferase [Lachnospiraceae bacterium]
MPISLCEQILDYVTYKGEVVLDSFAGSGVVGEAALMMKRSCILIEILKENVEKIKQRFEGRIWFQTVMG